MKYQWHIFLASLDPTQGSEQAGRRPVLVVSRERINQLLLVVNIIPIALCYQIRTLDKNRLERDLGELTDPNLRESIAEAVRFQLKL